MSLRGFAAGLRTTIPQIGICNSKAMLRPGALMPLAKEHLPITVAGGPPLFEAYADPEFWKHYRKLAKPVQELADRNFRRLQADPNHLSLQLKSVGRYWSVRVGLHYRALGIRDDRDDLIWFWIGSHADYDGLTR